MNEIALNNQFFEIGLTKPQSILLKEVIPLPRRSSVAARRKRFAIKRTLGMCGVYVVRDRKQAIYVGSTNYSVIERIPGHLNGKSKLGLYIQSNKPESDKWIIDFYRVADKKNLRRCEKEITDNLNPLIR